MERQLLLLGVLRAQKMHGYQLNDFLERRWDFVTDLKPSTAYYLLDKLAADGYVAMQQEQVGNRPPRRVYEITPKGEAYFFELLRTNLSGHFSPVYADEVGLAYLDELPADDAQVYLALKRAAAGAELERLEVLELRLRDGGSQPVHLALDHHLTLVRAELAWLDRLITQLATGEVGRGR